MRKHRLFGVVIAALLCLGAFTQSTTKSNQTNSTRRDAAKPDSAELTAVLPAGAHPAGLNDSQLPSGFVPGQTTAEGDSSAAPAAVATTVSPTTTTVTPTTDPGLTPETTTTRPRPKPAPTTTTSRPPPSGPTAQQWAELRQCESHDNYQDNTGNGFYGAYQFSEATWMSLGYSGLPSNAPPAEQDAAAQTLLAREGWRQWPACSAELGL